jgi:GLPGLI family protein
VHRIFRFFYLSFCVFLLRATTICAQTQRVIAECTIQYSLQADSSIVDTSLIESIQNTVKTIYIKGKLSRVDILHPNYKQTILYEKQKAATLLREIGNTKLVTKFSAAEWIKQNNYVENAILTITNTTKPIKGYVCKSASLQLTDGSSYEIYFTTSIIPSVREFEYVFKDIPGFVLEYIHTDKGGEKIKYTAEKINLSPVPLSMFDYDATLYRLYQP